jgi:mRNA interferase YafQ
MINLVFSQSFKRAFKTTIKRQPELKLKIEAKLRLLADDPYNPILCTHKLKGKLSGAWAFLLNIIAESSSILNQILKPKKKKLT